MVKAGTLSPGQGFGQEFLISFGLVLVVYAAACDEINAANVKGSAPLAIGLAIAIGHLFSVSNNNSCVFNFCDQSISHNFFISLG